MYYFFPVFAPVQKKGTAIAGIANSKRVGGRSDVRPPTSPQPALGFMHNRGCGLAPLKILRLQFPVKLLLDLHPIRSNNIF